MIPDLLLYNIQLLCQCVWLHTWLVVIGVNYFNGYCCWQPLSTLGTGSINYFACPQPVSCYTTSLHHIDDNSVNPLEHFHTKTPSVKVSDNCGFRYPFHKIYLYAQPFESTWPFQLSMRLIHLIPFQWSIAGLDIAETTRIYKLCQGKFYLFHSVGFQQLKHMVPYSFNPFHIESWNIKVSKTITLDNENRRRFTRMHTIFLCNFSKYASCDSPNTPFLLSRWISILIIESH
jgi:hypothetical protein